MCICVCACMYKCVCMHICETLRNCSTLEIPRALKALYILAKLGAKFRHVNNVSNSFFPFSSFCSFVCLSFRVCLYLSSHLLLLLRHTMHVLFVPLNSLVGFVLLQRRQIRSHRRPNGYILHATKKACIKIVRKKRLNVFDQ